MNIYKKFDLIADITPKQSISSKELYQGNINKNLMSNFIQQPIRAIAPKFKNRTEKI